MSHFSSVEDLKSKFCSTVANDIMLVSTLGVIRMWADEASRKSRFRILFTTYQERKTRPLAQLLFIIMKDDGCKMTNVVELKQLWLPVRVRWNFIMASCIASHS